MGLYGRIQLNSAYVLDDIAVLQDEKDLIKGRMINDENARLELVAAEAEKARVLDFEIRLGLITNYYSRAEAIGKYNSSMHSEYERIIKENDITTLLELEAQEAIDRPSEIKKESRKNKKERGKRKKVVCNECLDLVRDFNDGKTGSQVDAMKASFGQIYTRLKDGSPSEARLLIEAVPYDGVIDELKDDLLDELTEGGF